MKFEEFKSGEYRQQYQYKSFLPEKINHEWTWGDPRVNVMLEKATKTLGELNAFTLIVPDVDLFIRMHVIKEANTSSRGCERVRLSRAAGPSRHRGTCRHRGRG